MKNIKYILLISAAVFISKNASAYVNLDLDFVLGAYHQDPVVSSIYVDHRSPYSDVGGSIELTNDEPTILPYDDGCTEYCDSSYVVVDHFVSGGVVYPISTIVVLNPEHTRVISVRFMNDRGFAERWHDRAIHHPERVREVVRRHHPFGPQVREKNVYVVHRQQQPSRGREEERRR